MLHGMGVPEVVQLSWQVPSTVPSEGSSERAGAGAEGPKGMGWQQVVPGGLLGQPPKATSSRELGKADTGVFK